MTPTNPPKHRQRPLNSPVNTKFNIIRKEVLKKMKKFLTSKTIGLFTVVLFASLIIPNSMTLSATDTGFFSVLTYNVAGLPELLSGSNPSTNTIKISSLLNDYDLVAVQEDFAYHGDLLAYVTHPYLTATSGNVPFGDGLNFISRYNLSDTDRETWWQRYGLLSNGSDQLTPKGFMYAQMELGPGLYVDVYTLHADAENDSNSIAARCNNMRQIASYINTYSNGNAVIVLGDTNSRYTRAADNFESALLNACSLADPWIELVRNGSVPADGATLNNTFNLNGANYEEIDKIFYRSSKAVKLTPQSYRLETTKFRDGAGNQLSDHYPVAVTFQFTKATDITLSEAFGGSGGFAFNYLADLPDSLPVKLTMRSGNLVNATAITYADGLVISIGGAGGTAASLTLEDGEYLKQVSLCRGITSGAGNYQIFYASFQTNIGRTLAGGTSTDDATTFTAPNGWYIAGLFGRSGTEVDKLGVIYKPLP
jgi:endonuclease/exonuclease/phosphatase family metal-dependent hydrolase